jgi:hypothetical protein
MKTIDPPAIAKYSGAAHELGSTANLPGKRSGAAM